MTNLTQHKCAGKCPEFKSEQCHHCLIQQIEKREFELGLAPDDAYVKSDFVIGDVVVCTSDGTKDLLLEIIEHNKNFPELYQVRILSSGTCGPIHKNDIRSATPAELHAKKRLPSDLNKHLDSALAAKGEVA